MATKPFLTPDQWLEADRRLKPPSVLINGDETRVQTIPSDEFSNWLQRELLARFEKHPMWSASQPVALGSWSRDELAPRSDIDILFTGRESDVSELVAEFSKQGLKLRYRVPEDPDDWTKGVEPFDVLALIGGRSLTATNVAKLEIQKAKIRARWPSVRKTIVRSMLKERQSRSARYDSIANYLEPNLKYGPGGLRDLEQALALRVLFPERFESADDHHAFDVLRYYKRFFLLVRQKLHLSEGASDLLTAPEQAPLATWLGFASPRDFMKEIQKGVSRVSFYADWAFEKATSSQGRLLDIERFQIEKPTDLFEALKKDPSVLMQNRVRSHADRIFAEQGVHKELGRSVELDLLLGRELGWFIDPSQNEAPLNALFRSRLIDHCVPEFRKIVGHVQHDQYHRFSVDAHILQAVRELGRLWRTPSLAGPLTGAVEALSVDDWGVLSFACLYHDIAKGHLRDQDAKGPLRYQDAKGPLRDHATEGARIAEHDLRAFGKSIAFIEDVIWIVREHLSLSSAAFRENPASPRTWAKLALKGVVGHRIRQLAVFTTVDIRATNPDAWTPWKAGLLSEVVRNLESPGSAFEIEFGKIEFGKIEFGKMKPDWVERLDPFLLSMIPAPVLASDLESAVSRQPFDLSPRVVRVENPSAGDQTWIRLHSAHDKAGLFAHFVSALGACGLSIRHASVHTFPEIGAYDWFEVKTERAAALIEKRVTLALTKAGYALKALVVFDRITLVSESQDEWVVSFRGKDQSSALLRAVTALSELRCEIQWARVHTWGLQIDDVFGIKAPAGMQSHEFIKRLEVTLTLGQP